MNSAKPKLILVACGRAIATSMLVANTIKEELLERGVEVETIPCTVSEVPARVHDANLVVSTAQIPEQLGIPVIVTLAFLTGMGKDRVLDQIISNLR